MTCLTIFPDPGTRDCNPYTEQCRMSTAQKGKLLAANRGKRRNFVELFLSQGRWKDIASQENTGISSFEGWQATVLPSYEKLVLQRLELKHPGRLATGRKDVQNQSCATATHSCWWMLFPQINVSKHALWFGFGNPSNVFSSSGGSK